MIILPVVCLVSFFIIGFCFGFLLGHAKATLDRIRKDTLEHKRLMEEEK